MPEENYNDLLRVSREVLEAYAPFYFASLSKHPRHGQEGARDALYITTREIRKGDLVDRLEEDAEENIENGNGLTAEVSVQGDIARGAGNYMHSLSRLKPRDIIEEIKKGVIPEIQLKYEDMSLGELGNSENEDHKKYAQHLLNQLRNSIMIRFAPEAYLERAKKENQRYARESQNR